MRRADPPPAGRHSPLHLCAPDANGPPIPHGRRTYRCRDRPLRIARFLPSRGLTGRRKTMAAPVVTMQNLIEAGAHFGHQTHRWNPRMKPYIFGARNGIHILDLSQTVPLFARALDFISSTSAAGGKVLLDRKRTRLNSSNYCASRLPS